MPVIELVALPKQKAFILAEEKQCLYSGAFGAGKSFALCAKAVLRASRKNAREALVRKVLSDLKATTLKTLLNGDGDTPPVLPPGSYEHNKNERTIKLLGGGEIVYFSLEDSSTIGSYNLSGAGVDQAEELSEDDWLFLMGRLRLKAEGVTRQMYGVCNPDSPSHHLAQRFGLSPDRTEPIDKTHWVITTASTDNPHLPADYVAELMKLTGVRKKRYVMGIWAGAEGVIYEHWDRTLHKKKRVIPDAQVSKIIIGVDDGTSVPFACGRFIKDKEGRKHLERMVYRRGMLSSEKVEAVRSMLPFDVVIVDPAAAGLKLELRAAGFEVRDGINEPVLEGIQECQTQLTMSPGGEPWFTVDDGCVDFIREIETYEWEKVKDATGSDKKTRDKPVKENDHAMDLWRYVSMEDRIPAAAAVDEDSVRVLAKTLYTEPPRFTGSIDPKMGWCPEVEPIVRSGDGEVMEFSTDVDGPWKLWCTLGDDDRPDKERPYVLAVSVATGAPGSVHCLKVGDAESKRVIAEAVLMNATPEQAAKTAVAAGLWFGGREGRARMIWNHSGGGIAFYDTIRRLHYGAFYRHVVEGVQGEEAGWRYSPAGMTSLLGNLLTEVKAGRYLEATRETLSDLQRWAYNTEGTVAPLTSSTEGEAAKNASDRAMAAMLLAHAFQWVAKMSPIKPKLVHGSLEWLEAREKNLNGIGQRPSRLRRLERR